ncbi:MAG: MarR family transcriptional regulator [Burkholderiales bacterium]
MPKKSAKPTPAQYRQIVFAWREMRRGVAMGAYRDLLFEGLELSALDALDLLVARDRLRMTDFANALRIEKSTATRALDRLESAGLAERTTVDAARARRAVVVRITKKGRLLQAKLVRRRVQLLREMTREFTTQEVVVLGDLLDRLVQGIDAVVARVQERPPGRS